MGRKGLFLFFSWIGEAFVDLRNGKARPNEKAIPLRGGLVCVLFGWESSKRHRLAMWIGISSVIAERKSLVGRR